MLGPISEIEKERLQRLMTARNATPPIPFQPPIQQPAEADNETEEEEYPPRATALARQQRQRIGSTTFPQQQKEKQKEDQKKKKTKKAMFFFRLFLMLLPGCGPIFLIGSAVFLIILIIIMTMS